MFITHRPTLTVQLHNFDLFRTCRTSSFCTVVWQLVRFQLTRCIARSLGDSWASCLQSGSLPAAQPTASKHWKHVGYRNYRMDNDTWFHIKGWDLGARSCQTLIKLKVKPVVDGCMWKCRWKWRNFVPYICQLVFAAILWVKLWKMLVTVIALKYAVLVS